MNDYEYYRDVLGWNWVTSGEDLNSQHLRNGHEHAKFDSITGQLTDIHYDEIDPHNSLLDMGRHMWQSDLGKAVLIAGGLYLANKYYK